MLITTKKGDGGMSEYFGKRVSKGGKILEAIGTMDELQAIFGLVGLEKLQKDIYEVMGKKDVAGKVEELEKEINKLETKLKIRNEFVIFKKEKAMMLNWARTVARRAERRATVFKDKNVLVYLNRLSDFLYLLALKEEK